MEETTPILLADLIGHLVATFEEVGNCPVIFGHETGLYVLIKKIAIFVGDEKNSPLVGLKGVKVESFEELLDQYRTMV